MPAGLSRRQPLDPSGYGFRRDQDWPLPPGRQDLRGLFGPDAGGRLLELELGPGKGTFLVQHAPTRPDRLFVGIEWASPFFRFAADRARRLKMANVRFVRDDGVRFVPACVADASVAQFHWYHPDPWPKKKHWRRRSFQAPFLRELHRVLMPADPARDDVGRIRVQTDHAGYFSWMLTETLKVADLYRVVPFERPAWAREGESLGTNFERKYRHKASMYGLVLVRR